MLFSIENGQIRALSSGVYDDVLRRSPGYGWQIARRHLDLDLPY
jgi:hypothetical protein